MIYYKSNFHTIKSILNEDYLTLKQMNIIYFHTIKSILNSDDIAEEIIDYSYFHTIKSILNLNHF